MHSPARQPSPYQQFAPQQPSPMYNTFPQISRQSPIHRQISPHHIHPQTGMYPASQTLVNISRNQQNSQAAMMHSPVQQPLPYQQFAPQQTFPMYKNKYRYRPVNHQSLATNHPPIQPSPHHVPPQMQMPPNPRRLPGPVNINDMNTRANNCLNSANHFFVDLLEKQPDLITPAKLNQVCLMALNYYRKLLVETGSVQSDFCLNQKLDSAMTKFKKLCNDKYGSY